MLEWFWRASWSSITLVISKSWLVELILLRYIVLPTQTTSHSLTPAQSWLTQAVTSPCMWLNICHTSSIQWSINESILIFFAFTVPSRWARLSFRCPHFLPILSRAPSSATNLCTVCSWRGSAWAPCRSSPSSWSYISCDPSRASGSWASSTAQNLHFNHKHTVVCNFPQCQVNNKKNKKR